MTRRSPRPGLPGPKVTGPPARGSRANRDRPYSRGSRPNRDGPPSRPRGPAPRRSPLSEPAGFLADAPGSSRAAGVINEPAAACTDGRLPVRKAAILSGPVQFGLRSPDGLARPPALSSVRHGLARLGAAGRGPGSPRGSLDGAARSESPQRGQPAALARLPAPDGLARFTRAFRLCRTAGRALPGHPARSRGLSGWPPPSCVGLGPGWHASR
jgi:hypothetical protein